MREVAVIMCEDPAVKEVKRYRAGSSSHDLSSIVVTVVVNCGGVLSGEQKLMDADVNTADWNQSRKLAQWDSGSMVSLCS